MKYLELGERVTHSLLIAAVWLYVLGYMFELYMRYS